MTEKSYFHGGAAHGDARYAPYTAATFDNVRKILQHNPSGYVIPDYLNNFIVSQTGAKSVSVASGAALVDGVWFESTVAETLLVTDNTSQHDRIDRVVIRVDYTNRTVALAVLLGRAQPVPEPSALTQTDVVYEASLAQIRVASGFAASSDSYIYDERRFINTAPHYNTYATQNMMFNSEFIAMAWSGAKDDLPALWGGISTPETTCENKFDQMNRGTTCQVTLAAADTLYTQLKVVNAPLAPVPVTVRMLIEVEEGLVGVGVGGVAGGGYYIGPTNGPVDIILRRYYNNATPQIDFSFTTGVGVTSVFKIGQIVVTYGYVAGEYGSQYETILFESDAFVRSFFSNSTGTYTVTPVDFDSVSDYGESRGLQAAQSILLTISGNDSGSAGNDTIYERIQNPTNTIDWCGLEIGREVNDQKRWAVGWVRIPRYNTPWEVARDESIYDYEIVASGATFDTKHVIAGVIT